ncbi:MAG: acyltransferase family protein, partial [Mycobacteriales bacterium]
GLSWFITGALTPFRLDGLALGSFLAVAARQPGGLRRLVWALPRVMAVVGGLLVATVAWVRLLGIRNGLGLMGGVRPMLIEVLLAGLLMWALIARERSATSRFFKSRFMMFLGTYSYGLYVYHHFIAYYLISNRTELKLAPLLGSHGAAVALQATVGAAASLGVAYLSYELIEKRFLRLKRLFGTVDEPARLRPAAAGAKPPSLQLATLEPERLEPRLE